MPPIPRNITLIVPFAPGGGDILARLVGGHLQQAFGCRWWWKTAPLRRAILVARAAPDGYTFLLNFNTMSVHTMNHALFAS